MYLVIHAAVGGAVGDYLAAPAVSALAGFSSHFLLDIIPHGDERSGRVFLMTGNRRWFILLAMMDGLAAISLVIILWLGGFYNNVNGAMLGAAAAILPDFLVGMSDIFKNKLWPDFVAFHERNHCLINYELPMALGGVIQAAVLLIALFISWK